MTLPFFSRSVLAILIVLVWGAVPAVGQDTRGSLVPDGKTSLADGTTSAVEDLKVGTVLWTWLPEGKAGTAKVIGVRRQHADSFILLKAGDREVRASGAQRVALAGGKLVRIDTVKAGDKVWIGGSKGPVEALVTSVRLYIANMVMYDLTLEGHRPFLVDGVMVGD